MKFTSFRTAGLSALIIAMSALGNTASAQSNEVVASGVGTGYIQSIYSEWGYYYHRFAVPYDQYADGSFRLKKFANGKDFVVGMSDVTDRYDDLLLTIDDCEGLGRNLFYAPFPEYPNARFDVYFFDEPVVFGYEQIKFIYLDDTSHYNPYQNALVLDYESPDQEEYLLIAYFDEIWDGEMPEGIETISAETTHAQYDLMGRPVSQPGRGLHISHGKVSLQR